MTPGKAAAQAGHAFVDSYTLSPLHVRQQYLCDGGTKIVLAAAGETELRELHGRAIAAGLVCVEVIESHHVMPPSFDGSPVLTAVGLGPVERERAKPLTKGFRLM